MTQMSIHMYKVNLYMKYQSAVEILSMLASRVYCLKMPLNTVFVSSVPLKRARWPPIFITILDPTWLVKYLCQVSLQIYGRIFFRGITLRSSFFERISNLWNDLLFNLRSESNINSFKMKLKSFYFARLRVVFVPDDPRTYKLTCCKCRKINSLTRCCR